MTSKGGEPKVSSSLNHGVLQDYFAPFPKPAKLETPVARKTIILNFDLNAFLCEASKPGVVSGVMTLERTLGLAPSSITISKLPGGETSARKSHTKTNHQRKVHIAHTTMKTLQQQQFQMLHHSSHAQNTVLPQKSSKHQVSVFSTNSVRTCVLSTVLSLDVRVHSYHTSKHATKIKYSPLFSWCVVQDLTCAPG